MSFNDDVRREQAELLRLQEEEQLNSEQRRKASELAALEEYGAALDHNGKAAKYFLWPLEKQYGKFAKDMADEIRRGKAPFGRARDLVCTIAAQAHGHTFDQARSIMDEVQVRLRAV